MANIEFFFNKSLDIQLISKTFEKSFNTKFDVENWVWRFQNNPNEKKVYISYVIENNILAAYYAVSPCILEYKGIKYKVALSNMTMTHPDYQGKGYFKLLGEQLYGKLKEDNYIGVFGFANSNSHYGFRKYLNWQDLAMLNIFNVTPTTFRQYLIKHNDEYKFEVLTVDSNTVATLKDLKVSNNLIEVNRSIENYEWRLKNIPSQKYQLLSLTERGNVKLIIVFKFYKNELDLMEIFFNSDAVAQYQFYLGNSINYLISNYQKEINIWSNLYSEEHLLLEKFGFKETSFNTYFGYIPFTDFIDMINIKNWHYRFYDSDVF